MSAVFNIWWIWVLLIIGPWILNFVLATSLGRGNGRRTHLFVELMAVSCGGLGLLLMLGFFGSVIFAIWGPLPWWQPILIFASSRSWSNCRRAWINAQKDLLVAEAEADK